MVALGIRWSASPIFALTMLSISLAPALLRLMAAMDIMSWWKSRALRRKSAVMSLGQSARHSSAENSSISTTCVFGSLVHGTQCSRPTARWVTAVYMLWARNRAAKLDTQLIPCFPDGQSAAGASWLSAHTSST